MKSEHLFRLLNYIHVGHQRIFNCTVGSMALSIFGSSDLLQILRKQAAFSFAVPCIIMFFQYFGGPKVFSDPICCLFLTWFGHDYLVGQFLSVRSFLITAAT